MSDEVDIAKKNIFRQQYQHLMEEAEKETRRREDERHHELLSENPLDINYARCPNRRRNKTIIDSIICW